jgi:8-oxo-dGTP pyrophosphatase MutT (NUDIX family)
MIVTAAGIIIFEKKILLVKRVSTTLLFPGCWACPGGKAEAGESPAEAAIREVKEETNLDFEPSSLFKINYWKNREMYRFFGSWSGNIKLQETEIADSGWFSYNQAKNLDFAFDYKSVLEELNSQHFL